ncbi:hypothetical protein Tco_0463515 [Tanacetum coccineum]
MDFEVSAIIGIVSVIFMEEMTVLGGISRSFSSEHLGGGSKLFAALSMARISLGLLDRLESKLWFSPR